MEKSENKSRIEWGVLLPAGEYVSMRRLAERLELTERETRELVMRERLAGVPICATTDGYIMADREHLAEVEQTIRTMKKRGLSSLKQASILNRWLKANGGAGYDEQITIEQFLRGEECQQ